MIILEKVAVIPNKYYILSYNTGDISRESCKSDLDMGGLGAIAPSLV